ncbi:MAG: C4-type zinc ribbon domain-containing protein [Anaerolineales bacterium]|nr:C4-type zinc ribbon domain-containing protein [Anaerolineales bacterium]
MSQVSLLYRLQQLDSAIDRAQQRLKELATWLSDETALQAARASAEESALHQKESERQLKRLEAEMQALQMKLQQTESSLYSGNVRNPRELQDLQQDAISIKKHLTRLEEQIFEAMLAVEEASQENARRQEMLANLMRERQQQAQAWLQEQTNLQKDLQRLQAERAAALPGLTEAQIDLYEQLRRQKRGLAVAEIREKTCSACGATLTPAQVQSVRSAARLEQCPSCNRILYAS